uniref:Menorin-like domain-containing protein n=1 Tax=Timema shepardi TaxID=629360 RepID=A0A7R9G392_TIMSH|nr:unnamed protein product [Timema shepardi]
MIKFPLWLNAVTDDMEDEDIDKFLSLCTHNFPKATISIGMLHSGQRLWSKYTYSAELVTQMKDTLTSNNVTQTVAFPVKFLRAVYSVDTLSALKDVQGITDSALYIYAGNIQFSEEDLPRHWAYKTGVNNNIIEETYRIHLLTRLAWNNGSSPRDEHSLSRPNRTLREPEAWQSERLLAWPGMRNGESPY